MGHEGVITERAYARVGLLGNPSDIYWGRTLALAVKQFEARVTLMPNADATDTSIAIVPCASLDLLRHGDLAQLRANLHDRGYQGGVRLLLALLKVFAECCEAKGFVGVGRGRGFSLRYETNVPYRVGLSGSSAIVCAALRCLVKYYALGDRLVKAELPNLMLKAENELGIVAGYMDRVIQVYGGLVYMDFDKEQFQRAGHGVYEALDPSKLPDDLYLMFQREDKTHEVKASGDSGPIHATVRERWLRGDDDVHKAMQEFRCIAEEGRRLLTQDQGIKAEGAAEAFAALMRRNFSLRRSLFGDAALGQSNLEMIGLAESFGGAAKFTGSGGAIVVYCPSGDKQQVDGLRAECDKRGFSFLKIEVAGPTSW